MYSIGNTTTLIAKIVLYIKLSILNLFHVSFLIRYLSHMALSLLFLPKDLILGCTISPPKCTHYKFIHLSWPGHGISSLQFLP